MYVVRRHVLSFNSINNSLVEAKLQSDMDEKFDAALEAKAAEVCAPCV